MRKKWRTIGEKALVGQRLRVTRDVLGLNQEEFARVVGKTSGAISMWETGDRLLDPLAAAKLAERYGLTTDWFYLGRLGGVRNDLASRLENAMSVRDREE
jgi:transcriptional regulator with XRE-family HTH domain